MEFKFILKHFFVLFILAISVSHAQTSFVPTRLREKKKNFKDEDESFHSIIDSEKRKFPPYLLSSLLEVLVNSFTFEKVHFYGKNRKGVKIYEQYVAIEDENESGKNVFLTSSTSFKLILTRSFFRELLEKLNRCCKSSLRLERDF